jgi:alpha-mannosidase
MSKPSRISTTSSATGRKTIHLICNAHLDPVWLWEWEEGAAEALSTFRTAADLCEEFDDFVFCHNEAVLYQWVEEYEPALFARIQRLVKAGRWHIMGGWYLQPDCNMPSGESFVRQILAGRTYFRTKFGVTPTTAINFDPFGHSRGLVQIMAKSGYDSYLFCRPAQSDCPLPGHEFRWIGYDGSEILGSRCLDWYNSPLGKAREKIESRMKAFPAGDFCYLLWGVGNHGGGPSRKDLRDIRALMPESGAFDVRHSTPEAYAADLARKREILPCHEGDLNAWAVGCYTTQVRIKQMHRRLENELFAVEKMAACATAQGLMAYPAAEIKAATRDLLFSEFHDILPGSSIQAVEDMSLRVMGHGLEELSRAKARTFFALAQGQPRAAGGEIPVLVFNPHPYPVRTVVACEFQLADVNNTGTFTDFTAHHDGRPVPTQIEKEASSIPLDWRKRVVFEAELKPMQMNRFDCRPFIRTARPQPALRERNGQLRFSNGVLRVAINVRTGLIDSLKVAGKEYLARPACRALVMADDEDPWGMRGQSFRSEVGSFELMAAKRGSSVSGVNPDVLLPSVRVIEDGAVRTVVEAVYAYGDSFLVQQFKLPKQGTEVEVFLRVHWNEKDRFLKLSLPLRNTEHYVGQVAFGVSPLREDGRECVAQKWVAVTRRDGAAVTVVNEGSYGSDFKDGELRLSLLRSPAYSAHPIGDRATVPQDRYSPRIDQGERTFRFWIKAGDGAERLAAVDREALAHNEAPMALSFFPSGAVATRPKPLVVLGDPVVQLVAAKPAEQGRGIILRLYNPTPQRRTTVLKLPLTAERHRLSFGPHEVRSIRLGPQRGRWTEVDLIERRVAR